MAVSPGVGSPPGAGASAGAGVPGVEVPSRAAVPPGAEAAPGEAAVRPLSLRRNFSWTLAGNAVYAGCQWGVLVVLAKLGTPEMVGQFALGLAITAPVIMLASLQLRAVQATDAWREHPFGDYLALRLLTTALALPLIASIVVLAGYRRETALVILAVGAAKGVESVSDAYYGLFQQHERMDRIARSLLLRGPAALLALALGVYLTGSVLWGAAGMCAAWSAVLAGHDMREGAAMLGGRAGVPRWNGRALARLAGVALPLGLTMMLISLNANVPRYFVERYLGEADLGVFAAMAYLMTAGGMVVTALGQSASPRLARQYAEGDCGGFSSLLVRLSGLGLAMGVAGLLAALVLGREVLTLLYGFEYAWQADVLAWLMGAAAVGYVASFLGYGMTAARLFRVQPVIFVTAAAAGAALAYRLVPAYGLRGAAWAVSGSMAVQLAGSLLANAYALRRARVSVPPR